jgi:tagatose-1,6-bisphosphate aldolase
VSRSKSVIRGGVMARHDGTPGSGFVSGRAAWNDGVSSQDEERSTP